MGSGDLVDALVTLGCGDRDAARELAAGLAESTGDDLARVITDALDTADDDAPSGVYDTAAAFQGFIDGGSNVALYEHAARRLRALLARLEPASLIDVGCGDGRLTAALLDPGWSGTVDLVEPAHDLARAAVERLATHPAQVTMHELGVEEFLDGLDDDTHRDQAHWDVAMSTFALHNLEPARRRRMLGRLRTRCTTLALVEFDVPAFADGSREHATYVVERYRQGIAEYADRPDVVAGFLAPVLLRQFEPGAQRHTFEQPLAAWLDELSEARFTHVGSEPVADYWWAPASLIVGR